MNDSSAATEPVEWIDPNGSVIDVVDRARMRRENLRHRSVTVVVMSTDGRVLVQRRADTKDLHPGWWDIGAGGVVGVGESDDAAAVRELAEELGVHDVELAPLGNAAFEDESSKERSRVYVAVTDGPFEFADGEVAEVRFVTNDELRSMLATVPFLPACEAAILPLVSGFQPG